MCYRVENLGGQFIEQKRYFDRYSKEVKVTADILKKVILKDSYSKEIEVKNKSDTFCAFNKRKISRVVIFFGKYFNTIKRCL